MANLSVKNNSWTVKGLGNGKPVDNVVEADADGGGDGDGYDGCGTRYFDVVLLFVSSEMMKLLGKGKSVKTKAPWYRIYSHEKLYFLS